MTTLPGYLGEFCEGQRIPDAFYLGMATKEVRA